MEKRSRQSRLLSFRRAFIRKIFVFAKNHRCSARCIKRKTIAAADELYQKSLKRKEEQYGRDVPSLPALQKNTEVLAHLGRQSEAAALRDRASRLLGKRQ